MANSDRVQRLREVRDQARRGRGPKANHVDVFVVDLTAALDEIDRLTDERLETAARSGSCLIEIGRLRAENEALRADCEQGRELLREMSTHHDRHHEWDKIADGVFTAAHDLWVEVVRSVPAESMPPNLRAALATYMKTAMAAEGDGPAPEVPG